MSAFRNLFGKAKTNFGIHLFFINLEKPFKLLAKTEST
jgi:hypothetical protein